MEHGNIKIKAIGEKGFEVEVKLIDNNIWLTKQEIASLFNVFVGTIESNFRSLFKSGILREEEVTRMHSFEYKGRLNEIKLYNLEALVSVSFRISSFEAKAFRGWIMRAFLEQCNSEQKKMASVLITCKLDSCRSPIILN